jgi:hypothetical protein
VVTVELAATVVTVELAATVVTVELAATVVTSSSYVDSQCKWWCWHIHKHPS